MASTDEAAIRFNFGQLTDVLSLTKTGDFGLSGPGDFSGITGASDSVTVLGDPFGVYNLSFTSLTTGFLFLTFENGGGDDVGAILDAVTVSAGTQAVPKPSTWVSVSPASRCGAGAPRPRRSSRPRAAPVGHPGPT
jgi:hypothetical protein